MRLAPSHAGGRFDSGILATGGGGTIEVATGVPCSLSTGPSTPAVTVPQSEGAIPGKGVIVQQVTMLRTKKKPNSASTSAIAQKMTCPNESGPIFLFLRELSVFIQVLYIPYPSRVFPSLFSPNAATKQTLHPSLASSREWRDDL